MPESAIEPRQTAEAAPSPRPRPSLLASVLETACEIEPGRALFRDQPGREAWSGRMSRTYTCAQAGAAVRRLASALVRLDLPPMARVAVCLPGSTEACVTILAVERAGLLPCILPLGTQSCDLLALVETLDVRAAITQARFGTLRPAEAWCAVAANYFRLRFLLAFGPEVPDGVIDLDALLGDAPARSTPLWLDAPRMESGLVTFAREGGVFQPVYRTCRSLVASAAPLFAAAKIRPGERILSFVAGDDLKGSCTGLVAALMSGALLEVHELFDARAFVEAMAQGTRTHIVCPGWAEPKLSGIAAHAASTILVHDVPLQLGGGGGLSCPVVDVLAFGERALLAIRRTPGGAFTLTVEHLTGHSVPPDLLDVRLDEDGRIAFRGLAAAIASPDATGDAMAAEPDLWRDSGRRADIFAGILLGIA